MSFWDELVCLSRANGSIKWLDEPTSQTFPFLREKPPAYMHPIDRPGFPVSRLPSDSPPQPSRQTARHNVGLPSAAQSRTFMPPQPIQALCNPHTFTTRPPVPALDEALAGVLRFFCRRNDTLIRQASAGSGLLRVWTPRPPVPNRSCSSMYTARMFLQESPHCHVGALLTSQSRAAEAPSKARVVVGWTAVKCRCGDTPPFCPSSSGKEKESRG